MSEKNMKNELINETEETKETRQENKMGVLPEV